MFCEDITLTADSPALILPNVLIPAFLLLALCAATQSQGQLVTDWLIDGGLAAQMASSQWRRFANLAHNNINLSVRVILTVICIMKLKCIKKNKIGHTERNKVGNNGAE